MTVVMERPTGIRTRRPDTEPEPTTPEPATEDQAAEVVEAVEARKEALYPTTDAIADTTLRRMQVLGVRGVDEITWHPDNEYEVEQAAALFASMKKNGALLYKTDANGGGAEAINTFDRHAERIMATPQLVGG